MLDWRSKENIRHTGIRQSPKSAIIVEEEKNGFQQLPFFNFNLFSVIVVAENRLYPFNLALYVGAGVLIPPQGCLREKLHFVVATFFSVCFGVA